METSYERTTTTKTYNVVHSVPPHSLVIMRTGGSPGSWHSGGGRSTPRTIRMSAGGSGDVSFNEGHYTVATVDSVNAVKLSREEERKDMLDLNDRFASYIEKLRESEAQNRKLADELDKLRTKWGKETEQIKAMFQAELDEARQALDDAEKEKARLEIKVASDEEQIEEIRLKLTFAQQELVMYTEKLTRQTQQITDYEYEISLLRKQLDFLETERKKDKNKITELEELLAKAREDLDKKTLDHIDTDKRRQTLEEQIEFMKSIHDQEMKELVALAYRDTSPESRDFWKNELAQAILEIEQMYAEKLDMMTTEMKSRYELWLQQLREAAERQVIDWRHHAVYLNELRKNATDLRDKINDLDNRNNQLAREIDALRRVKENLERELEAENVILRRDAGGVRAELDAILRQLQMIMDNKMGLELEIAAYRKLLEGEETRTGLREVIVEDTGSEEGGVLSAKTTYWRAAKGPIALCACPPDGKRVKLENTGRRRESIMDWTIRVTVDGKEKDPPYTLDDRFKALKPGAKITIWAKDANPSRAGANDFEMHEPSWGIGSLVITRLYNTEGEELATLTQITVYS